MPPPKSSPVPNGVKSAALAVGLLLLTVSVFHASWIMWKLSDDPLQRVAMVTTVIGLLASSHVLARLAGATYAESRGVAAVLCILCLLAVEAFSIATSAASLGSRVDAATRAENHSSPEYEMAMTTVRAYERQIRALQDAAAQMPVTYVTKRMQTSDQIVALTARLERAQRAANEVNVSTTGRAFDGIEASTGLSATDVTLVAAVMLSAVPMAMGIAVGALSGRFPRQGGSSPVPPGKKPQGAS